MTSEISKLPAQVALGLIIGFIAKYKAKKVDFDLMHKLALEVLRDGRSSLVMPIVASYPIPEFEKHQDPDIDLMTARLDAVRASLPGVYKPVHAVSYRMQQTIKQVADEKEAESPLVDYRKELIETLNKYPVWRALVIHEDVSIRLAALTRLGDVENPIKEAAIVLALGDDNIGIRQRARTLLGEAPPVRHRSSYSARDVAHRGTLQQALNQIVELDTDHELRGFLDDPRPSIRYAAAIRLKPESELWDILIGDAATRVRRVMAQNISMTKRELVSKLLQDPNQTVRTIIGKRKLAEPIEIPVSPSAEKARRKAEWESNMGDKL